MGTKGVVVGSIARRIFDTILNFVVENQVIKFVLFLECSTARKHSSSIHEI